MPLRAARGGGSIVTLTYLGSERVFNAGRIEGNLLLGDGADLFDNALGTHVGWASLGWGTEFRRAYIGFDGTVPGGYTR